MQRPINISEFNQMPFADKIKLIDNLIQFEEPRPKPLELIGGIIYDHFAGLVISYQRGTNGKIENIDVELLTAGRIECGF